MMSFLYVWQTVIQAPLVAASAAIGFSQYLGYLIHLNEWQAKAVSAAVIVFITFLLYRKIDSIGKIGVSLWAGVKTIYSYLGHYNVCHLGGEIKNPGKNIPASMFISVIGIAILYLARNMS